MKRRRNILLYFYTLEASASFRSKEENRRLKYFGEVLVPESGEVRHDIMVDLEE